MALPLFGERMSLRGGGGCVLEERKRRMAFFPFLGENVGQGESLLATQQKKRVVGKRKPVPGSEAQSVGCFKRFELGRGSYRACGCPVDAGVVEMGEKAMGCRKVQGMGPLFRLKKLETCIVGDGSQFVEGGARESLGCQFGDFMQVVVSEGGDGKQPVVCKDAPRFSEEAGQVVKPLDRGGAGNQVQADGIAYRFGVPRQGKGLLHADRKPVEGCRRQVIEPPLGMGIALCDQAGKETGANADFQSPSDTFFGKLRKRSIEFRCHFPLHAGFLLVLAEMAGKGVSDSLFIGHRQRLLKMIAGSAKG